MVGEVELVSHTERMAAALELGSPRRQQHRVGVIGDSLFVDDHCANCLEPLAQDQQGLYCSELRSDTTKNVRYIRRKIRNPEEWENPDVQEAVRTRLAHLLAGGYHEKARRLPVETRDLVLSRDEGACVECGEPGEEIDHISGDSNDPSNLQLLCRSCHHAKTALRMRPTSAEQNAWIEKLFVERIYPDAPAYRADDDLHWRDIAYGLYRQRVRRLADAAEAP